MAYHRIALATKNAPPSLHLPTYAVVWLLLDRFQPPDWVWGVAGTVCALIFLLCVIDLIFAKEVPLHDNKD